MSLLLFLRKLLGVKKEPEAQPRKVIKASEPSSKKKPDRYFTLGIDFGTHGTKIAYRDANLRFETTKLIALNGSGENDRAINVFPSLVTVSNDRLNFGRGKTYGTSIENFKIRIGEKTVEAQSQLTYEDISTLFLAYVLCESAKRICADNSDYTCKIMLQLGAPFNNLTDESIEKHAYDRILSLIWRLYWHYAGEITQGMQNKDALQLIQLAESHEASDEQNWRWLVSEIQAVVTNFAQSTDILPYSYHLVLDMGGFTTDFSIFNVGNPNLPRASIFVSEVIKEAIIAYDASPNKGHFCDSLRNRLYHVIQTAFDQYLLNAGQFVNFNNKALWRIGGGYYRDDIFDTLLDPTEFLKGFNNMEINPQFRIDSDRMFLVAKGLATYHANLIAIIQAQPLPVIIPPPNGELPYHLQDHN